MRKSTRRRNRDNDANQRQLTAILFAVVFVFIWQTFSPPPAPVQLPSQQAEEAQNNSGVAISTLSVEQIASQAKPAITAQVVPASMTPAKPIHTLLADQRFEVVLDSRGEISKWSVLEDQYRRDKYHQLESVCMRSQFALVRHQYRRDRCPPKRSETRPGHY